MTDVVENVLGSTAVWSDELCRLKDFPKRHALPAIALIQKGTYRGIGQGQSQGQQVIYIHEVKTGQKILAEGVKQKALGDVVRQNSRKGRGMKYSFPVTYGGWFEVLSEDGKPIQPIQGVEELSKAAPQQCLVREAFKAPVSGTSSEDLSTERLRQVNVGERLTLRGEVEVAFQGSRGGVAKKCYLRCSDDRGEYVYLPLDLRTQFSPIAGPTNIAGVHSIKGLLEKFRLPIVVRLVHGVIPARVQRNFIPVFRLLGAYTDETAFLLPLPLKDSKMVTVSTREPLVLAPARNWEGLRKSSEFELCRARCETSIKSYQNSVHILVDQPDPPAISKGKLWLKNATASKSGSNDDEEERLLFEEIEDIYRYVREGGDPPAPRTRPTSTSMPSDVLRDSLDLTQNIDLETQEATLNISDTASAKNQALLVVQRHSEVPEDDGYWEEPIYEDIAKIRERKMAERASVAISNENEPATLPPMVNKGTEQRPETELKTETKSRTNSAEPGTEADLVKNLLEEGSKSTGMVQNLRQIFLPSIAIRLASSSLKRKATVETTTETSTETPLIPPKCFDETTGVERSSALFHSKNESGQSYTGGAPKPARTSLSHAPTMDDIPVGPKSPPPKVLPKKLPTVQTPAITRGPPEKASNPPSRNSPIKKESVSMVSATPSSARNSPSLRSDCDSPKPVLTNRVSTPEVTKTEPVSVLHASKKPTPAANGASSEPRPNLVSMNHLSEKRVSTPEPTKPEAVSIEEKPKHSVSAVHKLTNQLPEKLISTPKIQKSEAVSLAQLSKNIVSAASKPENLVTAENAIPSILARAHPVPQNQTIPQNPVPQSLVLQNPHSMNSVQGNHVAIDPIPRNQVPTNPVPVNQIPPNDTNPVSMHSISANLVSTNPVLVSGNPVSVNHSLTSAIAQDSSRSATPDPQSFRRSESPPRPIKITTTSSRVNWASGSGSTIQVGPDANAGMTATAVNGVTTIKVTAPRLDSKTSLQGQYPSPGNTRVHVRLPNSSIGHAVYRPQGSTTGLRIQSGTVYLANSKVVENDHWA